MQHGREGALPGLLLENARHVVVRLARVDDQRQPGRARRRDVIAETALLRVARAVIVEIVEPRLPDRHHLGMARARDQLVDRDVELLVGVVRVGADRAIDLGKALGDGEQLGVPLDPGRDGDDAPDAGRLRARDHGIELAREVRKIEMAVAVDQHVAGPSLSVTVRPTPSQCRRSDPGDAGELGFELGDLARQVLQDPLAQRRVRAERHFRNGLGERRNDLIHIDGILLAAR